MAVEASEGNYAELVGAGSVLVDFWGPRCAPCLAMMPAIEDLERTSAGRFRLVKVNAAENRSICREAKVLSLPTFILFRDGEEVRRLVGATAGDVKKAVSEEFESGR